MIRSFCRCGGIKGQCDCKTPKQPSKHPTATGYQTTTERGYGYDWQQLTKRFRAANPLCQDCQARGRIKPMEHIHHVVPIETDRARRLDRLNLVALCEACHSARHRAPAPIGDSPPAFNIQPRAK